MGKKKTKKKNINKQQEAKQRLTDIEIDEISLVDKPAIDEEFIVTKSLGNKGGVKVSRKKKIKKSLELRKGIDWSSTFRKTVDNSNTHCKLCGITKDEEAESVGMGLLCSTCFSCALEHMDKGVFDSCIAGTFDADNFMKENPDLFGDSSKEAGSDDDGQDDGSGDDDSSDGDSDSDASKTDDGQAGDSSSGEGEDENENGNDDSQAAEDDSQKSEDDSEQGADDEENEQGGDSEDSSKSEDEGSEDSEENGEGDSEDSSKSEDGDSEDGQDDGSGDSEEPSDQPTEKRVAAVEKQLGDIQEMLTASLDMHEQAAMMMSQMGELIMGSLELVTMMAEEQGGEAEQTQQAAKGLKEKIKAFRNDNVQKAGAKISQNRLNVLREIADKLSALIESVAPSDDEGKGKKGKSRKTSKSAEVESLKKEIESLKKSVSEAGDVKKQLGEMANRLNDIEASAGASTGIDDDEEDDEEESSEEDDGSVFKGFGPLQGVTERINKQQRVSHLRKGKS